MNGTNGTARINGTNGMHRTNGSNGHGANGTNGKRLLADRLRTTLRAARGNDVIRERLCEIVRDASRMDPIVSELGRHHAVVLELLAITGHELEQP